ncbi:germination protein [Sporomusaceae bacterium FL31]|nr:germination protein [Sporomusaceae bacterium FL31]GCE35404.1 germination protein [Sporomusaceae bacterium]
MRTRTSYLLSLVFLLLLTIFIAGCAGTPAPQTPVQNQGSEQANPQSQSNNLANPPGTMRITIYHATKDAQNLVPEIQVVPNSDHPAKTAIERLIAGTKQPDLVSVVPPGTKLRGVSIKEHVAYVDFNDKLIKNNGGGSAGEVLLVAAIVNTLTEFPEVQKVQILVEGKKIDTISGHLDTSEPLSRSEKIIKK